MSDARLPVTDIVFDLGGVLIDWNPRHLFVGRLALERDAVERFLRTVCTSEWHLDLDRGMPFESAARRLLSNHPEHADWIRTYCEQWDGMFAGQFDAVAEALYEWHGRGYRLHALTNYPGERIAFLYERFDFMKLFHSVVVSGLLGAIKPDARIFEYLRERLSEARCVFIDDRPENVAAAVRLGFDAVQFRGPDDLERVEALLRDGPPRPVG